MDEDFFDAAPVQQNQPEYEQYQQFDQGDVEYAHYETSSPTQNLTHQSSEPATVGSGYGLYSIPAQSESTMVPQDDTVLRIRREEEQLTERLRLKADAEYQAKQGRKDQASRQLNDFLNQLEKQKDARREANRESERASKDKIRNYKSPWEQISANIALKQSDYAGTKDVSRMREAILHKRDDDLSK